MDDCNYSIDGMCCFSVMGNVEKCYRKNSDSHCPVKEKFETKIGINGCRLEQKIV